MVAGKYASSSGVAGFMLTVQYPTYTEFLEMFFISYQTLMDASGLGSGKYKATIMHELGHTFTILIRHDGAEYYDWSDPSSCMDTLTGTNTGANPIYSYWWWTNNWWNLREDLNTQYPTYAQKANTLIDV